MFSALPESDRTKALHRSLALKKAALWVALAAAVCVYAGPFALEILNSVSVSAAERDAQRSFPHRPITILAPANPGGGWDQLARVMQHVMTVEDISPVPVEVINRGGAGGTIALAELIIKDRADPYTLMVGGSSLVSALVMHESRFNLSEVALIARLASEYDVIAVPYDSPFEDLDDLLEELKGEPESFVWGGGSAGSADHLLVSMIAREAGIDPARLNYVAYAGGGEAAAAVMGRQVAAGVAGYAEWKDLAAANKMRLLAISSSGRHSDIDIPTITEFGLDVVLENWRFVVAPPGIGAAERQRLLEMITAMRNSEQWHKILARYSWEDRFLTGPELEQFIADETSSTAKLLTDIGLGALGQGYAPAGPYLFPTVIVVLLALLAGMLAFQRFHRIAMPRHNSEEQPADNSERRLSWQRFALSAGLILIYLFALDEVGFYYATPVYLVLQALLMGGDAVRRNFIVAVFFTSTVYLLFEKLLLISVP